MSRRCELSGINRQIGHKVSHSNIKTKREFQPNLVNVTLATDALGQSYKLRITAAALRTVGHRLGPDARGGDPLARVRGGAASSRRSVASRAKGRRAALAPE